jgi:ADP-ribose pyrophosphatase YjhB (NUDIX family)
MSKTKIKNYYDNLDNELPVHLSVGAVLVNDKGQVCCHYYDRYYDVLDNVYILMRETVEPGETLEAAVYRGLKEEWGATAVITNYIGSIVSTFPSYSESKPIQKTTIYFLCHLESQAVEDRQPDKFEDSSTIEWLDPKILAAAMESQAARLKRTDMDESSIIRTVFPE